MLHCNIFKGIPMTDHTIEKIQATASAAAKKALANSETFAKAVHQANLGLADEVLKASKATLTELPAAKTLDESFAAANKFWRTVGWHSMQYAQAVHGAQKQAVESFKAR